MIRILIEDSFGGDVILDAVIDVPKRRVVSLAVDDEEPMAAAFIALAVVSGELEACEVLGVRKQGDKEKGRDGKKGSDGEGERRPEPPTCEGGCE